MNDATQRPGEAPDPDAWERACAEDLAAENARRRGQEQPGTAAEELRKLMDAVAGKVSEIRLPAVQHVVEAARAAVEPVVERNPEVFDHLAAAGSELMAAYRAAVAGHERRWTRDDPGPDGPAGSGSERIDLD
ncbi:DUF5304 domain-containing protein [Streptomyces morookaense]|uniref:DUF5304 domain-containing protein n=1 Tax=Streptomyces morookaense TaxID=1970 RepID=A0A7Y7B6F6_STRMO|nr:DUF5304 domain-containing protein [Streptomyces morookaense]NVK79704.1 DUF5304 domain-containing protein [Streptomyces morookaense]GHF32089.1 hypothetical protein GCM10010359_38350 [Streptomyces morookaense]